MDFNTCLTLAKKAKGSQYKIENHILNGVPDRLKDYISDFDLMINAIEEHGGNPKDLQSLYDDKEKAKEALKIYL